MTPVAEIARITPDERDLIILALSARSNLMHRRTRSRKWAGERFAEARALMRQEARTCDTLMVLLSGSTVEVCDG